MHASTHIISESGIQLCKFTTCTRREKKNELKKRKEGGEEKGGRERARFILPVGILALAVSAFRLFEKLFFEKTVNTYSVQSLSPVGSERTNLVVLMVISSCTTLPLFIMVMTYDRSSP